MTAVLKSEIGTSLAEGIINEIISRTSKYYYFLGKDISWTPGSSIETPELPIDTYAYDLSTRAEIITLKQIKGNDVSYVVPRYDWTAGIIYDMYDYSYTASNTAYSGATRLEDAKYYVLTDNYSVYKCISNNYNTPSTIKPTGTDSTQIITSDGYIWKFMFVVPIAFINKFLQPTYLPVTTSLRNKFYTNGSITNFGITNPGTGYVQGTTSLVVQGDGYLAQNPYILNTVAISNPGYGYSAPPGLSISPPVSNVAPVQAIAASTLGANGIVSSISLTNIGYGYGANTTIAIAPPYPTPVVFGANTSYILNTKVKYLDNYYNVTTAGTTGVAPPTNTTGTFTSGTVVFTYVATQAYAYILSTKTEASLTPVITNGQLTNIIIADAGIGYTSANVTVIGAGTGALVVSDTSIGNLDTVQTNVELLAVAGSIDFIKVTSGGSGYSNAAISIVGDGSGATATSVLINGTLIGINMVTRGTNYTKTVISIVGDGIGATARAIISPLGGHGKNAIEELHARTLMFFSTLANDSNQGLKIVNDYRQLGIIKNPKTFGTQTLFNDTIGSACYLLNFASNIDTNLFTLDMKLSTIGKEFIIVAITGSSILVQSINNSVPVATQSLVNPSNIIITPISVVNPTVDKYSGYLLFIDNRNAFTTTAQQAVNLRTTIKF